MAKPHKKKPTPPNRWMCFDCGDVMESKYRHNFVQCKCTHSFVDGGDDYMRLGGTPLFIGAMNGLEFAQTRKEWAKCKQEGHKIMKGMGARLRYFAGWKYSGMHGNITQVFKNGKVRIRFDESVYVKNKRIWKSKSIILDRRDIDGEG